MTNEEMSNVVEKTLTEVLTEIDGYSEGDLIIDWALIASVTNPSDDEGYAYPMLFRNGEMPSYRGIGLFEIGSMLLKNRFSED